MLDVLMIAPTPFFSDRGCHIRIYEEARSLAARGVRVRVATYHLGREMAGISTIRIANVPWYRRVTAGPSAHKLYLDLLLYSLVGREIRRSRPDILHGHLHEGAAIASFHGRRLGIPVVFDHQGGLTEETADHGFVRRGGLRFRALRGIERWVDHRADRILASSAHSERHLVRDFGVPAERIVATRDGIRPEDYRAPAGPADAVRPEADRTGLRLAVREGLGIHGDAKVVVYAGVMSTYQGIDLLLASIARLERVGTPGEFLFLGYPEEEYRRMAAAMGIGARCHFAGRTAYEDLPRLLTAADLAVSPKLSVTEGNQKLLAYRAASLPTVVFDTPVNRELLGEEAIYADEGEEGLARSLQKALEAPPDSLPGRQPGAIDAFSWDRIAERIHAEYLGLLEGRR